MENDGSDVLASSSSAPREPVAGPSPYHESSQFRDWRYSPSQLSSIREALNVKSREVVARNTELEKVRIDLLE